MIQNRKTRQKFDKVFKQRAVELWLNSGKTAVAVAANLGIHAQRLSAWRERLQPQRAGDKAGGIRPSTAEQLAAENLSLRRENKSAPAAGDVEKNVRHPVRTTTQRYRTD